MTEFSDVWQGVVIILGGTFLSLVVIFFGGVIWDNWWGELDEKGLFDQYPDSSYTAEPALMYGNAFYTAGILGIVLSWSMGLLTVYRRQRYDQYLRQ